MTASIPHLAEVLDAITATGEIYALCTGYDVLPDGSIEPTGLSEESAGLVTYDPAERDGETQEAVAYSDATWESPEAATDWGTFTHLAVYSMAEPPAYPVVRAVIALPEPITVLAGQRARIPAGYATVRITGGAA